MENSQLVTGLVCGAVAMAAFNKWQLQQTGAAPQPVVHVAPIQADFDQNSLRLDADLGMDASVDQEEASASGAAKEGKNRKKNRKRKERKKRKKSSSFFPDIELKPNVVAGVACIVCGLALAVAAARRRAAGRSTRGTRGRRRATWPPGAARAAA